MTINMKKIGVFPDPKSPFDEFAVSVDLTTWLGADTISTVAYVAKDEDGTVVTTDIVDTGKSTKTSYILFPYIKGGTDGLIYNIYMSVTTTNGDKGEFYLQFKCSIAEG